MLRDRDYIDMEGSKFLLLSGFYFFYIYSLFFLFIILEFLDSTTRDNKKTRINPRHLQILSAMMRNLTRLGVLGFFISNFQKVWNHSIITPWFDHSIELQPFKFKNALFFMFFGCNSFIEWSDQIDSIGKNNSLDKSFRIIYELFETVDK